MDPNRAEALAAELIGQKIGSWTVQEFIDAGKSAAVFRATDNNVSVALKVFDRDLIARFGPDVQLKRIEREVALCTKPHPNIVNILGGGYHDQTNVYYVVMEFLPEANLSKQIAGFNPKSIPELVSQLALAAKHLESLGLVHRDIKPSNIIWNDSNKTLKLLDLGVLAPVGSAGQLTDLSSREFIGTLQYSSPEYLLREENDTIDGWRAVNFYQIGAVIHDLIMGKPLFQEFTSPYGRLVNAVQHEQPLIQNASAPPHLLDLARKCLVKDPGLRLTLVGWASFDSLDKDVRSTAKERVTNRLIMSAATHGGVAIIDHERQRAELAAELSRDLRSAVRAVRSDSSVFPSITVTPSDQQLSIRFAESTSHGLPDGLTIVVRWNILDPGERVIELTGRIATEDDSANHETTYFKGIVDKAAVYLALEELMYSLLDGAQQAALTKS